ncbi:MAG: ATP-binding protein [Holophaga sp.]|jgi:PAS domain S-box-containing protein
MTGFSLGTAVPITGIVSLLICLFLLALSREQRAAGASRSYLLLGLAYGASALRLACTSLELGGARWAGPAEEVVYIAFISFFWLGVRAYVQPRPLWPVLFAVPALLVAWVGLADLAGLPLFWATLPVHAGGGLLFALSGRHLWRLFRAQSSWNAMLLALGMWTQGLSTVTYPFTRWSWYAPYGFTILAVLTAAIGMGLMVGALREEQRELRTEMAARRESEKTTRRSLEFIEALLAHTPTGVSVFEGASGDCIHANQALAAMVGGTLAAMLRVNFRDLASWKDLGLDRLAEATLADGVTRHQECFMRSAFGKELAMECYLVRFHAGEVPYLMFVATDITERHRLLVELQRAEHLESLGSLAGGVAHDMNNVLTAILGLASTLRAGCAHGDPRVRSLDTIATACARGRDVVRSLLYFARKDPESLGPVDLNAVAREVVDLLSHTTLNRVDLTADFQEPVGWIEGDASALSHALINLCVNAVDAMPEGGSLQFRTRVREDRSIQVSLRDSGKGMSPEVARRCVEPFFTTKPAGKGTGLGLAMVYGTMKAHKGALEILSEEGRGTEVVLTFPPRAGSPAPAAACAGAPPAGPSGPGRPLRVLLVDDDELIRESVAALLAALGHEVRMAEGGREALDLVRDGLPVDLVVLDMNMPGLSGTQTLQRLLALRPGQAVLMASGYSEDAIVPLMEGRPNLAFLPKPFSLKEVRAKLKAMEGCWAESA